MSCACGHHHPARRERCDAAGIGIDLAQPMIALRGRLVCADAAQMMSALSLLPDYARQSRARPGTLRFDLSQGDDPLVWDLDGLFLDNSALAAHEAAGTGWQDTGGGFGEAMEKENVLPQIRPESAGEYAAIDALLQDAFDGPAEARLVRDLRDQGDLAISLVAEAGGMLLGHIALSPLTGPVPALALAPVAVTPKAQGRGIGAALIRAAIAEAGGTPVVVLGDPAYYSRFGFRPAVLGSPYAGPYLQLLGDLPEGTPIAHAPAFAAL